MTKPIKLPPDAAARHRMLEEMKEREGTNAEENTEREDGVRRQTNDDDRNTPR